MTTPPLETVSVGTKAPLGRSETSPELWAVGSWLSAALDDPKVCAEMKRDINEWFDGNGHHRPSPPSLVDQEGVRTLSFDGTGRCVVYEGDPLYDVFKPSREAIAAIERHEIANAQALAVLSEMMSRHVTNWPNPKRFGTAVSLIDKTLHQALAVMSPRIGEDPAP